MIDTKVHFENIFAIMFGKNEFSSKVANLSVGRKKNSGRQNRQKSGARISKAKINLGEMKNHTSGLECKLRWLFLLEKSNKKVGPQQHHLHVISINNDFLSMANIIKVKGIMKKKCWLISLQTINPWKALSEFVTATK